MRKIKSISPEDASRLKKRAEEKPRRQDLEAEKSFWNKKIGTRSTDVLILLLVFMAVVLFFTVWELPRWNMILDNQTQLEKVKKVEESLKQARARAQAKAEAKTKVLAEVEDLAKARSKTVAEEAVKAAEFVRIRQLATVGEGEGIEHAFIRQLIYDPSMLDGVKVKIGKKVYDLTCHQQNSGEKAVKKWAQTTAHLLAITAGYVDQKTGREIRVKKPNQVAYILKVDGGEFIVDIYLKATTGENATDAEFGDAPNKSISGITIDYQATFLSDAEDGVNSFEFVWPPVKAKQK